MGLGQEREGMGGGLGDEGGKGTTSDNLIPAEAMHVSYASYLFAEDRTYKLLALRLLNRFF